MSTPPRPRISFAVPVYNEERGIRRCLDSILAQTFEDFEIVVSDNASTDRTWEILGEYAARDTRVRVFRNDVNVGLLGNFNRSFERTRGEFFRWVGGDDWFEPEYAARCVAALDANPDAIVATSGFALHGADGATHSERFAGERLESEKAARRFSRMLWFLHAGATKYEPLYSLMRRDILAHTGRIRLIPYNDYLLVAELALAGRFVHVPELLFHRSLRAHVKRSVLLERVIPGGGWAMSGALRVMSRELFSIVREAPLSPLERARCYGTTFRYLMGEVFAVCREEVVSFRRDRLGLTRVQMRRLFGARD
jgi:glycosyltransferase involved in cell wall biosynthesis